MPGWGPVWVEAITILFSCKKCGLMPNDESMWFVRGKREPVRSHTFRTRCCCAYCGAPSEHEIGSCIVTKQNGDEEESCMVYQAEYPPQENCESVVEVLLMPNSVHGEDASSHDVGSHRRVSGGLRGHTLEELAQWRVWSEQDRLVK